LSIATYQSCKDQKASLELQHTYDFLTWLRDEFDPLRAQFLARHPCVSLMDSLVEVRNEETRLQDAGLLRVSSVLVSHSSIARPATPLPLASSLVALFAPHGESTCLYCYHYGRDGHVDAFCYRMKKAQKAQAHRCSQGTGDSCSGGFERSSAASET
jgi:hypothetical protein